MALENSLQKIDEKNKKPTFYTSISTKRVNIEEMLGKERTARFFSAIVSAVSTTPSLGECDHFSLLSGALLGETLNLAHSPQLGQYYLVPFKKRYQDKNKEWQEKTLAQFILGVKGWKQLAIRSGQYETLNVLPVVEGEYKGKDRFSGEPKFEFIENDEERNSKPVIGYMAYFKLLNGFSKVLYRSKEEMLKHADRYSQAFSLNGEKTNKYTKVSYADYLLGKYPKKDDYLYSSFWYKDFDSMACGKVLKKLIQEYGVLSVDLQKAISDDDKIIEEYEKNSLGEVEVKAIEVDTKTKYDEKNQVVEEEVEETDKLPKKGKPKAQANENVGEEVADEESLSGDLVSSFFDTGDY